jgi:NAD(P)-dependent dehydrogenase (short-subunit alcohol dehydrogenase family)
MANVLVTGANRGIGLALATRLAARGDHVVAVCRQTSSELSALDVQIESGIDLHDERAVVELGKRVGSMLFDRLILNAGVLGNETLADFDADDGASVLRQFEINALAPLRLVAALRKQLAPAAKIGLITSRMGSIADNSSGGYYGYRMSKAALNAAGRSLALDLKSSGVAVFLLHPGFVRTDMTAGHGQLEPSDSARMLLERMDGLNASNSGTFWHANGDVLPW